MRRHELAEGFAALAVAELVETFFPDTPPAERAELMQRLRVPVLAAVLGHAAASPRLVRRRGILSLAPSRN